MNGVSKPTEIEIARETLRRLVVEKKPPTPDNYSEMYAAVAGNSAVVSFPEKELKKLHQQLPRATPAQIHFARELGQAITKRSWEGLQDAVNRILQPGDTVQTDWAALIRSLLQRMEIRHAGMTTAKKKEAIEHVLAASTSAELLASRLQALLRSWDRLDEASDGALVEAATTFALPETQKAPAAVHTLAESQAPVSQGGIAEMRAIVGQLLDETLALVLGSDPAMVREAGAIAALVRTARSAEEWSSAAGRLKQFCYRAHFVAEDNREIGTALMHLVHLIVDNIGELAIDDAWLAGQVEVIRALVAQPLTLRRIDEVERLLKDVIVKQSSLKQQLHEAKERLTQMLAAFVDRLADFSEVTGEYHDKIGGFAEKIGKAQDLTDLTEVLDQVMTETRAIQVNTARSRDELTLMQQRVRDAESEVNRLRDELSQTSQLVRHDALTGALNRKGMDEVLDKEIAAQQRRGSHLSLALLDIDNFKHLNDALGHAAGDEALKHLTQIVRQTIRPQDALARYGGEEFVILLPDTPIADAATAMARIQRALTRKFFMHNNEKVLITFSCGVVEIGSGEPPDAALKRADAAMYLAKRSGKNRVIPA
jgi:diguanylate cyclase